MRRGRTAFAADQKEACKQLSFGGIK